PLVAICAASRYLGAHLAARPRLLDLLPLVVRRSRTEEEALAAALRYVRAPEADAFARGLRRHKLVEVLRIALRDLQGRVPVLEAARELSWFAASTLEAAVRFHYARLCAQHGPPDGRTAAGPSGFCVLGMGKLGGTELNFSSDVDLLYVYDRDGRTQGPQAIDHFAFYARLAEEVTRAIGAAPFVFRVDLDLRPEGRSGPIVNSLRALELYYEAQGAAWERFALLKALPVAGDRPVGEDALRRLVPFVWRKYLDLSAVEEMRVLKMRAEREAGRRGGQDLKLGPGGIREVEFFAQALQLLHGGKDANLRVRGTLPALERLLFAGLISSRDRDELAEAYVFLRRLEHRVQMVAERQTHALPDDPAERARLARRADYPSPREAAMQALERDLQLHRGRVEARFRDLLRVAGGEAPEEDPNAAVAVDPQAAPGERLDALRSLGFLDAEASAAELSRLAHRRDTPFSPAAAPELQQVAPRLVQEAAAAPDPDQALRHLADLFTQLSNPRAITELLAASPRTARLVLSLFGSSDFLSRSLLRHPELIDQLVHRGSAPVVRSEAELRNELRQRLTGDPEHDLSELRRFRIEELLRIGIHDVAGALETDAIAEQLSAVAEACVAACFDLATTEIQRREGIPRNRDGSRATMVVIGLGKLGGRELGYHSDLDLLFLYSAPGETDGARRSSNHEHFARVAQRLISQLTLPLREGLLYRIDTRLRPSGSAGPLVVSFDALATYHAREARLWERQALLRARPVAGDAALFERASREVLEPSLFRTFDRKEAARELLAMRERMEREIADESDARYNSKLGRGGLVDVEFAVQFLQLVHGSSHPSVRHASTLAALAELRGEGLLRESEAEPLVRGYRFLRRVESRLRIVRDRAISHFPTSGRELLLLARRLGYSGPRAGEELLAAYERETRSVRSAFLRVLEAA
ncbi:MAG TPA: bifunctional [glutamate--ammonia ligase]-adenylyl-L-tyrosine phosphorylase/[glutamate--ammonia-ligase] adenylyltransferase, partial [Myxococcales bacterium]|nr:bifunctional [glutamate--ammonia ligase]-adenylyl-L-tyrosine phosphorylase/[glutamate--ammonia-ligase] adenylyltransferase [Myxococcales bacterium]